jgi:DNA-binding Xre family transcriptional regulator
MDMSVRNTLAQFIEARGITPYRFWKDTGVSQPTAYRLCRNQKDIPTGDVMDAICRAYNLQPGDFLEYVPDPDKHLF